MKPPDQDDIEADYFAMHLLVPDAMLREEVRKLGAFDLCEDTMLPALAKKFKVSQTIIAFRLAEMGLMQLHA